MECSKKVVLRPRGRFSGVGLDGYGTLLPHPVIYKNLSIFLQGFHTKLNQLDQPTPSSSPSIFRFWLVCGCFGRADKGWRSSGKAA